MTFNARGMLSNQYAFSLPSSSLLMVQLMHEQPQVTNTKYVNQKSERFIFINIVPGVGGRESRTFDWKSQLSIKYSIIELAGLGFVIKNVCGGNSRNVLPYSKYARSDKAQKMVTITEAQPDPNKQFESRKIFFTLHEKNQQIKHTIAMTVDQAYGLAMQMEKMAEKAMELEAERQITAPRQPQEPQNTQQPAFEPHQQQSTQPQYYQPQRGNAATTGDGAYSVNNQQQTGATPAQVVQGFDQMLNNNFQSQS
jgi:hypothetical protein